jgi:trigger factor
MNIVKENVDSLNALIKVSVEAVDYAESVDRKLKDHRKNAQVKGFRQGKAPMGMIKSMYYVPIKVEEVNKVVSESLYNYLQTEELRILGEPMAKANEENSFDFEKDENFEFEFEIGLSPEISIEVSEKDKYPYYTIKIGKKEFDEYKESVAKRYGEFVTIDTAQDDELIKCSLVKVNKDGEEVEEGIRTEEVSMSLDMMKDDDQKLLFKGRKKDEEVVFDVKKAYPDDTEIASLLRIDKDQVALIDGTFKCIINEIQKFEVATVNKELFDKIYGEDVVKTEQEFDEKLKEEMAKQFERDSEYRFSIDVRETMLKKAKVELPVEFLKRWLVETNENLTAEQVEEDFANYEDDFRWQLIKDHLIKQKDIKVNEEEILESAKEVARNQYQQYGIMDIPEEYLDNYAKELLSKKEEARKIADRKLEEKLVNFIKNTVKIDDKEITTDKFKKLFDTK